MQNAVRSLQLEKRDALRQFLEIKRAEIRQGAENGTMGGQEMMRLTLDLLTLEMEMAQSKPERVRVAEKMVSEARQAEEAAKSQVTVGVGGSIAVLEARINRLNYQIRLEEEKAKKP